MPIEACDFGLDVSGRLGVGRLCSRALSGDGQTSEQHEYSYTRHFEWFHLEGLPFGELSVTICGVIISHPPGGTRLFLKKPVYDTELACRIDTDVAEATSKEIKASGGKAAVCAGS